MADASDVGNYLRARGEYLIVWSVRWSPLELPPRTRRIPMLISGRLHPIRTTSAHAENTSSSRISPLGRWNYLRARGEYGSILLTKLSIEELPPRTRRIRPTSPSRSACPIGAKNTMACTNPPPPRRRKACKEPQLTRILSWGFGGAACGNRTHDLFITSEALYRLS